MSKRSADALHRHLRRLADYDEPLVSYYVDVFARRINKAIDCIPEQTLAAFKAYPWPGNIRELQNLIERAVILSTDAVLLNPLLVTSAQVAVTRSPRYTTLRDSEHALILQTLASVGRVVGGNTGAAARLGLKRTTLLNRMKKLGISRPNKVLNAESNLMTPCSTPT
jgi:formate hydrogenlyase transcriptional activator